MSRKGQGTIRFTTDERESMVKRYRGGESLHAIGQTHYVDRRVIRRVLVEEGVQIRGNHYGRRPFLPAEDALRTAELYGRGYSLKECAAMLGLNPKTVRYRLLSRGVKLRPMGGSRPRSWQPSKGRSAA